RPLLPPTIPTAMPNQASGTSRSRLSDHSAASTEWTTRQSTAASNRTESQPSRGPNQPDEDIANLLVRRDGTRGRGRRANGVLNGGQQDGARQPRRHHTTRPRAPTTGDAAAP